MLRKVNKKYIFVIFGIIAILTIGYCNYNNDSEPVNGFDYRIFKKTPAWELAQAVENEDIEEIKKYKGSNLVNYSLTYYQETILSYAILVDKYKSVKTLLEIGADPNITVMNTDANVISDTCFALRDAIQHSRNRDKYVTLLLKYGATKNINCDISDLTHPESAMLCAIMKGKLFAIKAMENYGGKLNIICPKHGSALRKALVHEKPSIINYLVKDKKVDFFHFAIEDVERPQENNILHYLRQMIFDFDSQEYKDKMKLVKYLQTKGLDYWKEPIPDRVRYDYRVNQDEEILKKY